MSKRQTDRDKRDLRRSKCSRPVIVVPTFVLQKETIKHCHLTNKIHTIVFIPFVALVLFSIYFRLFAAN